MMRRGRLVEWCLSLTICIVQSDTHTHTTGLKPNPPQNPTHREEYGQARDRLLNGLHKLQETNTLVESMKGELAALQPVLAAKAEATAELLARVDRDQAEAEKVKGVVEVEEADVKQMQQATQVRGLRVITKGREEGLSSSLTASFGRIRRNRQAMADEAQADLDEALPALEAALDSLKALNKVGRGVDWLADDDASLLLSDSGLPGTPHLFPSCP